MARPSRTRAIVVLLGLLAVLALADRADARPEAGTGRIDFEVRLEPADLAPGGEGVLVVTSVIEHELHTYADGTEALSWRPVAVDGVTYEVPQPKAMTWERFQEEQGRITWTKPMLRPIPGFPDAPPDAVWQEGYDFEIRVPVKLSAAVAPDADIGLIFDYSACDEMNCFDRVRGHEALVTLGASAEAAEGEGDETPGAAEGEATGGTFVPGLSPEDPAGRVTLSVREEPDGTFTAIVTFLPNFGYHLYKPDAPGGFPISVEPLEDEGITWKAWDYPSRGESFDEPFPVGVPFTRDPESGERVRIQVEWQGCDDIGNCARPANGVLVARWSQTASSPGSSTPMIDPEGGNDTSGTTPATEPGPEPSEPEGPAIQIQEGERVLVLPSEETPFPVVYGDDLDAPRVDGGWKEQSSPVAKASKVEKELDKGMLLFLGGVFLLGIGLAFTPCVLPIIPLTISVIGGSRESRALRKAKERLREIQLVLEERTGESFEGEAWFASPYLTDDERSEVRELAMFLGMVAALTAAFPEQGLTTAEERGLASRREELEDEKKRARRRLTVLLVAYVLGLSLTYGAAGALSGLFGEAIDVEAAFRLPGVILGISLLFIVLSWGMFGIFEMQPPAWMERLRGGANKRQGTLLGSFLLGVLAAVIASPCTGPFVVGMLAFVATTQSPLLGFVVFFTLGLGMGSVFFAAGSLNMLARPGPWMVWVRNFFGVVLVGVALYYLGNGGLVPTWGLAAIGVGIALLAWLLVTRHLTKREFEQRKAALVKGLWVAVGILFVTGLVLWMTTTTDMDGRAWTQLALVVAAGAVLGLALWFYAHVVFPDPMEEGEKPALGRPYRYGLLATIVGVIVLTFVAYANRPEIKGPEGWIKLKDVAHLQAEVQKAKQAGKPVVIDVWATWCKYCKLYDVVIEDDPYLDEAFQNDLVRLKIDVETDDRWDLRKAVGLGDGQPLMAFLDEQGRVRRAADIIQFHHGDSAHELKRRVNFLLRRPPPVKE